jgi:lysophospholipase L1-like esterase
MGDYPPWASGGAAAQLLGVAETIVLMGDSITALNGPGAQPGQPAGSLASGWVTNVANPADVNAFFDWANVYLGQRFRVVANRGVGGNTTTQMVARFGTDVLGLSPLPAWMMVMAGTNDLAAETPAAMILANIESMVTQALAAGIRVILGTCVPNDPARLAWGSYLANLFALNQGLRDLAWDDPGIILVDFYRDICDGTLGGWRGYGGANLYSGDGVHPSNLAGMIMGQSLANAVQAAGIAPVDNLTGSEADPSNLLTGGMFMAGAGGLGAGWTNRYDDTATLALVARSDEAAGQWQQIVIAGGPPSGAYDLYQYVNLTAGDTYIAECEFQTGNDWDSCTHFGITYSDNTNGNSASAGQNGGTETIPKTPPLLAGVNGALRTPPFTAAHSGNNPLWLRFSATSGTVRWGRVRVRLAS